MPRSAALPRLPPGAGATFYATILQLIKYGADYAGLLTSIALQSACAKSLSLFPLSLFRLPFFTLPIISNLKRLLLWQMLYQIICQICAIPELNKVIRIGNLLNFCWRTLSGMAASRSKYAGMSCYIPKFHFPCRLCSRQLVSTWVGRRGQLQTISVSLIVIDAQKSSQNSR